MCAIFGLLDYMDKLTSSQRRQIIRELGKAAEVRGTDATGIAFFHEGKLHIQKAPRPARRMKYRIPEEARYIMGHTRMTTQGSSRRNQNNHPFAGRAGDSRFALAHNGVIFNDLELRRSNSLPTTAIETDSYVAVQLIERQKEVSPHSLRRMAEVLEGHFTFTVLDQGDTMYFIRGDNPLTIWWCPDMGVYLYASTKEILERAAKALSFRWWRKEVIEPDQGAILAIDREGQRSVSRFDDSNLIASWRWYSPLWRSINRQEDEYLSMVMDMGEQLGISRQEVLMESLGVDQVYIDRVSGKNTDRPELKRMMTFVREGDTVIVESISRFARNTRDLLDLVERLTAKGVEFVSKKEAIDTTTPSGKFMLTIFGAVAELEREYILQRQREGIAIARERGVYKGRRPIERPEFRQVVALWQKGGITAVEAMKRLDLKSSTFYRKVRQMEEVR